MSRNWLLLSYFVWFCLLALSVIVLMAGLPVRFQELLNPSVEISRARVALGLSNQFVAVYTSVTEAAIAPLYMLIGGTILILRPRDRMAVFASLMFTASGASVAMPILEALVPNQAWRPIVFLAQIIGFSSTIIFFYLFPDGRFMPGWSRWLAAALLLWAIAGLFTPLDSFVQPRTWPPVIWAVVIAAWFSTAILAQLYRYRFISDFAQRQQTKWIVLGFSAGVILNSILLTPYLVIAPYNQSGPAQELYVLITHPLYYTLFPTLVPISIAISIFRYRLWDVDLLINRALVYGLLTFGIVVIYLIVVASWGLLFGAGGNLLTSLIATVTSALCMQPFRDRLQRTVNRLMYGERDDPYAILSQLSRRLETTLSPNLVLPTICETIAKTLKLPYVAIEVIGEPLTTTSAEWRTEGTSEAIEKQSLHVIPLTYQSELVGRLQLSPRGPSEAFSSNEQSLLADIARQAGIAVHNVRLAADLQYSRVRLVTTREEERRRLRRDLHDGLGPQLASQTLTLSAARKLLYTDPQAADELLGEAAKHAQDAISDIRRLVYDLRPPALDDLGLVAALRSQTQQYFQSGITFTVMAPEPLPPLPAAVEVACYRIAQEALTNVVKHSRALNCTVFLTVTDGLCVEASDDGQGFPANRPSGIGLASMRERVEELGGSFSVESKLGQGTKIRAWLPLPGTG